MEGWRCPVCGRGLSPFVSDCPCWQWQPSNSMDITTIGSPYLIPYEKEKDKLTKITSLKEV